MKEIAIGCDHAGYPLKEKLGTLLKEMNYTVKDFGCYSDQSVDYPDFGHQVAKAVEENTEKKGIVICGSGNGINMSVNKHLKVRGALCWNKEIAELARLHNNANILALPARYLSYEEAEQIVKTFLNTSFEGGRHQRRIDKI
ncbi:MAG: ribose 5-phosphate isomerase B [Crocinitomicaceae bacterium]|nr:ribose 5-phosphate isomerase B [Crocinitomicaceae bacterium]